MFQRKRGVSKRESKERENNFGSSEQLHTVFVIDKDNVVNAINSAQGSDCKTI